MNFNPELCRNESEVESKLIVQYLLPQLGYTPETWHQEIAVGSIRLDFLAFAAQVVPFVLDDNSPLSVVMEAKHPNQNLNRHTGRLKRYLTSLNVEYGLLTNGKELRIYQKVQDDIQLIFTCSGREISSKIDEIKTLIGRDSLKEKPTRIGNIQIDSTENQIPISGKSPANPSIEVTNGQGDSINSQPLSTDLLKEKRQHTVKTIAIYHNKGGVGKTTTVVNLAAAIRKKGKKVLIVDLDSQANTTFAAGLAKFDDEELDEVKDCNVRHLLQSEEFYPINEVAKKSQYSNPEIDVLPSHITLMQYETELNQQDSSKIMLLQKLKAVEGQYDVVIIDTPPSLNLYARIALITADYLIIPSDLKPFANQGLVNVKDFVKTINGYRKFLNKPPIEILGVLPCKISTNSRFGQYTLPKRLEVIPKRYDLKVMESVIYEREELAKCTERMQIVGNIEIPDPISVLDFKPDSLSAKEFELLAKEVLQEIGLTA
ncbi:AAA family ATPase [Funiculus sociatus GB2-A5]|uniref:AAA family ATPase n=1 Tax=Funiculus sociatus GB2-A5 TaxID=2933946 RepID=A0ABV0JSM2_9CYAN|nr:MULTISPECIES: AAA family ATPase [unclassified Trichocoleus]MBD1905331.1 AAA family ATPase [Trichocoleus sp. FACHB-832]MBD2065787.1 AAA family ATPase [Trichocoleus sp. FACHB-6]